MGMARSLVPGGSATGLSATDAWAEPLSMIAQLYTMARKGLSGSIQTGLVFFQVEPIPSRWVVTGVQVNPLRVACRNFQRTSALHVRDAKP
jgi:hypothetical protein